MAQVPECRAIRPPKCGSAPVRSGESGQALVESAIVMPLMIFLILGVIQLAMIQHAKIMSEYAAFNAARAGVVWNADPFIMENAAIISLLPVQENLLEEGDILNPMALIKRVVERAMIHQVNRKMSQAVGWLNRSTGGYGGKVLTGGMGSGPSPMKNMMGTLNAAGKSAGAMAQNAAESGVVALVRGALGEMDDRPVRVTIVNPNFGVAGHLIQGLMQGQSPGLDRATNIAMSNMGALSTEALNQRLSYGAPGMQVLFNKSNISYAMRQLLVGHFPPGVRELPFDHMNNPSGTLLTIRLRYMYVMRIPFANWVIHGAWMAGVAGQRLYGAIWNPQLVEGETGFRTLARYRAGQSRVSSPAYGFEARDVDVSAKLAQSGEYAIPIYASHSMRMQSDVYRTNVLMSQ